MSRTLPLKNIRAVETNETCCFKKIHHKDWISTITSICGKPATHTNGSHFFCARHAGIGRYVIREIDNGKILARFDTEDEVKANIHLYPGKIMQKITKSHRRTLI